ncbi:MAG: hypothetical protein A3C43_12150 [Candidatus Schekmanbacteria bacterium RIFCSPHIGHO2_02_FULL_38_11]|uniref:DUF507 domain-containing protein n=1 Tax=Candidatus Schekmanbacteria bacterium RIFCSPLOWO2_12_FULL_38_15 TaxID=1817883 RepID=A0A1F7SI33_9BACT|nr:MAG: hypothetical protein A2043_03930 [Candidatus Schekmanbacteria bacterium GWA2_38_9]OGL50801.1 MAG: hypothetical protein A3H37_03030 [Candidatus Schekmanbacteria bacterium RIFCSPLOWO2_02_FULL_38_14]OGL53439.1 MAG: hypothetical protein A3G31_08035 [Candidatus Schekmanbacteria bacterium RIFCSPLOWO2_12_FULL_38_15]OGL55044.1 MAG: hypothetical protein A3C43_12150 [Candidatus Schekmanbacteria bacterium RIFCSPHIGHO2_02_FULL_38_11]
MKTQKQMVDFLAKTIVTELVKRRKVILKTEESKLIENIADILLKDLHLEEEINSQVREILKEHSQKLNNANVDYNRMFNLIKKKIMEEKGLEV